MQSLSAASHHHHQNLNLPAHIDFINIWAFQVTKTWTRSKGKMISGHTMKAYMGVEIVLFSFLTLALDGTTGQLHALAAPCLPQTTPTATTAAITTTTTTSAIAASTTRNSPQYTLTERMDGLQSWSGCFGEKQIFLPGTELQFLLPSL